MKIDVSRVNENGITLSETVSAACWDINGFDIEAIGEISLIADFSRVGENILVKGKVQLDTIITCDRCQEQVERPLTHEFIFSYVVGELKDTLDIDQDVREDILLEYPMKVLCKTECKGICPNCGVNLNIDRCKCCKKSNWR